MEIQIKSHGRDVNLNDYQECIIEKYKLHYPFSQQYYSNTYRKILWLENVKDVHASYYNQQNRITTFKIYVAKKINVTDLNDDKYLSQDDGKINKEIKNGSLLSTRNTAPKIHTDQDEQFFIFEKKLLAHSVYHRNYKTEDHLFIIPKIHELPSFMFQPSLEEARDNLCFYIRYFNDLPSNRVANKMINFYMNLKYGN